MRKVLLMLLVFAGRAELSVAAAQEPATDSGTVMYEVRVGSSDRGWALIDRGSNDHLQRGDRVLFYPREGGTYAGTVVELEERAARVELQDRAFLPAPGTRGKVQVPRDRFQAAPRPRLLPAPGRAPPESAEPPVFENHDEEWQEGEPLLARVRPVRPEERGPSLHGRSYVSLDYTRASEDDRTDAFARMGGELVVENPFRRGDRFHADAEWNWRNVDVPDFDDERKTELRLDRFSYEWGGTRFAPEGWEVGRFLHKGMPEFGVLDGVEWIARRRDGSSYGTSLGFLPTPDEELESGHDFELSGFYRWVADESEELSASAGYQKTFHNGAADRDLIVASVSRLPRAGWTFLGTAWLDLYTNGDDQKDSALGLTQAYVSTGHRWEGGSSLDLVLSHLEFPQLDRNEFAPVEDAQLADDHNERLSLTSRLQMTRDTHLLTGAGVWSDEDENGGDVEFGFGARNFLLERFFADVLVFGTRGRFQDSAGGRFSTGRYLANGRWAIDYELTQNRLDGFSSANNDLPQHRLRFSMDHGWNCWNLSWRIEGVTYDDEHALTLGLYLQRRHY